jgi:hypothetical protein
MGGRISVVAAVAELKRATRTDGPNPNLPKGSFPRPEDVLRQLPAFSRVLREILLYESWWFLAGKRFNPCIECGDGAADLRWPDVPEVLTNGNTPVLIADATPNVRGWERILVHRLARIGDEPPVERPKNVRVVQLVDAVSGTMTMRGRNHREKRYAQLSRILPSLPQPVLIVCPMKWEEEVSARFNSSDVKVAHYFELRGLNSYEDFCSVVAFGTPRADDRVLQAELSALYAGDAPLDFRWGMRPVGYQNGGGQRYEFDVQTFRDPRVQSAVWPLREGELLQAAHRIRPLVAKTNKVIVLMTALPCLPPDHLTGFQGVLCPEWDAECRTVLEAAVRAVAKAEAVGKEFAVTSDVAREAFGSDTRETRRRVEKYCHEVLQHGLFVAPINVPHPLRNGGTGWVQTMMFGLW